MTTVAYCGKKLASDSQSTSGHKRRLGPAKKIFVATETDKWSVEGKDVAAFGFAGVAASIHLIKACLTAGIKHDTKLADLEGGFSTIIVCKDKTVFCWTCMKDKKKQEERYDLIPVTGPYAIGSGSTMAEAAMAIGEDAEVAVRAAIKLDTMSGGDVQVWELWKTDVETVPDGNGLFKSTLDQMKSIINKPTKNDEQVLKQIHEVAELLESKEIYPS